MEYKCVLQIAMLKHNGLLIVPIVDQGYVHTSTLTRIPGVIL